VPFWIASSMRRWCRLRRINDLNTMAADTPSSRTRVARNVYKYNELELGGVELLLLLVVSVDDGDESEDDAEKP